MREYEYGEYERVKDYWTPALADQPRGPELATSRK